MTPDVSTPALPFEKLAKGEDLREALNSLAWSDIIQPEIDKFRRTLNGLLVGSVLGQAVVATSPDGLQTILSKEQIAGQLYGLQFVEELFSRIIRDGARASDVLRATGLNYKPN